jgi:hypothetical protein
LNHQKTPVCELPPETKEKIEKSYILKQEKKKKKSVDYNNPKKSYAFARAAILFVAIK